MRIADFHVCFSHGKESGPGGRKIAALSRVAAELGWQTVSVPPPNIDSTASM